MFGFLRWQLPGTHGQAESMCCALGAGAPQMSRFSQTLWKYIPIPSNTSLSSTYIPIRNKSQRILLYELFRTSLSSAYIPIHVHPYPTQSIPILNLTERVSLGQLRTSLSVHPYPDHKKLLFA